MSIARRDLLKGAAVVGGATVLAGLVGCEHTVGVSPPENTGPVWDEEYDVVIVGAGGAGLIAAISAAMADKDAKIALFEKMSSHGGSSILSYGNIGAFGTDTLEDRAATSGDARFSGDTVDMYYEDKLASGLYLSEPEIAYALCANSTKNYYWLKSLGLDWWSCRWYESSVYEATDWENAPILGSSGYAQRFMNGRFTGINRKCRNHDVPVYMHLSNGAAIVQCLYDTMEQYPNITLITETQMKAIIREGIITGPVQGITVLQGTTEKKIRAKRSVVLACGGYAGNGEMMNMHDPRIPPTIYRSGGKGNTGDGIIAGLNIAAQTVNMQCIQVTFGCTVREGGPGFNIASTTPMGGPRTSIELDGQGRRFWSEMSDTDQYMEARLMCLKKNNMKDYWRLGDANSVAGVGAERLVSFGASFGDICQTLDEVAAVIGCSAATLKETLDRYNSFVENRKDTDFGKETYNLVWKIQVPPFYLVKLTCCSRTTSGGLRINKEAQVLGIDGLPIPNLYAAGETTGNVHGRYRNTGGDGWADSVCFGRIAGANSVKQGQTQ